ncbi:MAG TPA: hypothetical protein VM122_12635 [Usitatibacter sp.]|nr:hypothetical protein [Usitatibacter sp.]
MTTKLNSAFKRELDLNGEKYTLTVSPEGFRLVQKGKRKGVELNWNTIVNGEAALATALNASLGGARTLHGLASGGRNQTKH